MRKRCVICKGRITDPVRNKTCSSQCRTDYKWKMRTMAKHTERSSVEGKWTFLPEDWDLIKERFDHRCAYCGNKQGKLTMDHVLPLSRGGRHCISNVVPACAMCNKMKADMTVMEWKRKKLYDMRPWTMTVAGIKMKRARGGKLAKTPIFEQMVQQMADETLLLKYPPTVDYYGVGV